MIEYQPRTEVDAIGKLGLLAEDHREILKAGQVLGQLAAADRSTALAIGALLGKRQVDRAILGELR